MSTIKLNGTTSGSSIIKAPDSGSTNQTFTLPAATGTLATTADNGSQLDHSGTKKIEAVSTGAQIQNRLEVITPNDSSTHLVQRLGSTDGSYGYVDLELVSPNSTAAGLPRLDLQVGNSTVASFLRGGGITFNGDTAAANALDDYEEGTWTPTLIGSGGGTGTWASSTNTYTKVGRAVHFTADLNCTSVGNASNALIIGGLPFTNASAGGYQSVVCGNATGLAIGAGNSVNAFVNINDTKMYVKLWNATTGTAAYGFYISELTADGTLMLSGTYFTA